MILSAERSFFVNNIFEKFSQIFSNFLTFLKFTRNQEIQENFEKIPKNILENLKDTSFCRKEHFENIGGLERNLRKLKKFSRLGGLEGFLKGFLFENDS